MCRTQIFHDVLQAVSNETEIPPDDIIGKCRISDVVDARCILARLLYDCGLNVHEIASRMNMTSRNVRRLFKLYDCRILQKGNLIRQNSEVIRKQLGLK